MAKNANRTNETECVYAMGFTFMLTLLKLYRYRHTHRCRIGESMGRIDLATTVYVNTDTHTHFASTLLPSHPNSDDSKFNFTIAISSMNANLHLKTIHLFHLPMDYGGHALNINKLKQENSKDLNGNIDVHVHG